MRPPNCIEFRPESNGTPPGPQKSKKKIKNRILAAGGPLGAGYTGIALAAKDEKRKVTEGGRKVTKGRAEP